MFSATQSVFQAPHLRIGLLGNRPHFSRDTRHAREAALLMGARHNSICIINVPSDKNGAGHKTIQNASFDASIASDGALLLQCGSAAALQTADCPTLILCDTITNNVAIAHAGRPALSPPIECATCSFSVVDAAFNRLMPDKNRAGDVKAFIVGSICGHCFVHENPDSEEFVRPFDHFGEQVFTDRSRGALDLVAVIKLQLKYHGVLEENIMHDHLCTMENNWLASRRGGRYEKRNTIVVVRR